MGGTKDVNPMGRGTEEVCQPHGSWHSTC